MVDTKEKHFNAGGIKYKRGFNGYNDMADDEEEKIVCMEPKMLRLCHHLVDITIEY